MQRESFFIGGKEFAASKIGAFAANDLIIKIQKLAMPVLGDILSKGASQDAKNIMEMDAGSVITTLSKQINESVMSEIVFPMFRLAQVASVTDNIKIDSQANFDKVFTVDTLGDFYFLVFDVLKYNFAGFFAQMAGRFGVQGAGSPKATA